MEIGSGKWIDTVLDGAAQMGLKISPLQAAQFGRHGQLLMEWNRKINLTAITDPTQVAVKHFLDAIAPLNHIPSEGRLMDIGTGGGFPGIPLKIMRPSQAMTLIDSVRKKVNFVKSVIRQLDLDQIEALHTRAEDLRLHSAHAHSYAVIVCRALADLNAVVQMAIPLLADDGSVVVFHGPRGASQYPDDLFTVVLKDRIYQFQVLTFAYQLPLTGDSRSVTILKIVAPSK
jgi:16S rRNA (guanine527-N7)-methyltransferase